MIMSEKSKQHVDSCRFCWMCHHICPIGNATGHERSTPRARALGISLVNRGAMGLEEIMDNIYECAGCGACVRDCVTGWDPVMFTKEVRLRAAMDDKLPAYINTMVDNCLDTGNAYGKTALCDKLASAIAEHSAPTDTLVFLGVDTRYEACEQGYKAIKVLEKAGVKFTVLADEPASGAQLDFLIGAAEETKDQMMAAAKVMNGYKTVVFYDPADAKTVKQTYGEYGIELICKALTYTSFLAELHEMLLIKGETVWAGNILMSKYMPDVMKLVAERRIFNATSIGESAIATASVSEYVSLKNASDGKVEILSLEDLILG